MAVALIVGSRLDVPDSDVLDVGLSLQAQDVHSRSMLNIVGTRLGGVMELPVLVCPKNSHLAI